MPNQTLKLSKSLTIEPVQPGFYSRDLTTLELRTVHTPWGAADGGEAYLPGIAYYSTSSHGGYHLSSSRIAEMPDVLAGFPTFCGEVGWYEEDCDWCIVALAYPRLFQPRLVLAAYRQAVLHPMSDDKYQKVANWVRSSQDADAVFLREWVAKLESESVVQA